MHLNIFWGKTRKAGSGRGPGLKCQGAARGLREHAGGERPPLRCPPALLPSLQLLRVTPLLLAGSFQGSQGPAGSSDASGDVRVTGVQSRNEDARPCRCHMRALIGATRGGSVPALVAQFPALCSPGTALPVPCSVLIPTPASRREEGAWGPTGWLPGRARAAGCC